MVESIAGDITLSLITKIWRQEDRVRNITIKLHIEEVKLRSLELKRIDCTHIFSKPVLNYEHEGGTCIKCGINELYAHTLSKNE